MPFDRQPVAQNLVEPLIVVGVGIDRILEERERDHVRDAEVAEQKVALVQQRLEEVERGRDLRAVGARILAAVDEIRRPLPDLVEPFDEDVDLGAACVVGINTAVAGIGLGLAVPINAATRKIVAALMTDGQYRRAYLGIAGGPRPLPPRLASRLGRHGGVEIVEVVDGGPASQAGLRPEDLIVAVDGRAVEGMGDLLRLMDGALIGSRVQLDVVREGSELSIELVPVELEV